MTSQALLHLSRRLRAEEEVAIPIFDRIWRSRAPAPISSAADDRILIVEGNYLLLDDATLAPTGPAVRPDGLSGRAAEAD